MAYNEYLEEYYDEAEEEMNRYLEAMELEGFDLFTEDKEGVYKTNYFLRDNLQIPYVSKALAKPRIRDSVNEFVDKFIDEHITQLSTVGPVIIFTFAENETKVLYDIFGIPNGDETLLNLWNEMVKVTYYGKISSVYTGLITHAPHKLLLIAMIIEGLQKGYDDIVQRAEQMFGFTEYPIMYRKFWKLGVKEELMKYTIEHLSSKYKVRQMKNLLQLLYYDSHVEGMYPKLKEGADNVYPDLIYRIRNNIKNKFKNISKAYYDNDELGLTQHTKDSQFDDGSLVDQEGHTTIMSQSIDNTINKFATGDINKAIAKYMADGNNVDKDNLIGYLNQIKSSKDNKINKFLENVITAYFNRNPQNTSVASKEFLNFGLALFRSIGTSKDDIYVEIKNILGYWMNDIINITSLYSSGSTISNYTRAIFNYFIFMIFQYN